MVTMDFRLGELFCGAGGLAFAAKNSKVTNSTTDFTITPLWANDYCADACETHRKNICTENVICSDIADVDMSKLPFVDALAFGFPCNDFSELGKKKGFNGSYGRLYQYCIKALKVFKPRWFLAENVGGLRSADEGTALKIILQEMADTGYDIFPHFYKFQQYGVPQSRQRVIIVGIRRDLNLVFKIPAPLDTPFITCKSAIENPPIPADAKNQELTAHATHVIQRLQHIKAGENAFTANLPEDLRLKVNGAKLSQIYKRLDPSKPAYTLTGSGGGGTHMYHWDQNRALTNRERARLQTFPDTFVFLGSKESVRKQIGMAVPPIGAKLIFEAILKAFASIDYEFVEANIAPIVQGHTQTRLLEEPLAVV
jgi:DNA (cytosine-5)-methyltransferase 1